jgi:hypothetical protein
MYTQVFTWYKVFGLLANTKLGINGTTTLSMPTLSITTFCTMKLSIKGLYVTLSMSDNQHK